MDPVVIIYPFNVNKSDIYHILTYFVNKTEKFVLHGGMDPQVAD